LLQLDAVVDAANMFITSHRRVTGLAYCGFTFTARRYAGAEFAVALSVCPSQAGVVAKRLDESS